MLVVEESVLARAQAGDGQAFRELTSGHLRELYLHCYRMLGSMTDAEDVLQETLAAAWQGLAGFEGRSSLRTWLFRIATNRCLNAIRAAGRRRPPEPVAPFVPPEPSRRGEVTWLQPCPEAVLERLPEPAPGPSTRWETRESVELAFVHALQRLPPRQTAALLLCDVLGFGTAEAAAVLGTTSAAVKGALQRARAGLGKQRAGEWAGERTTVPAGSPEERLLAGRFAEAFIDGDVNALLALLTDDTWLRMPPASHEYHGRAAVAGFLRASTAWRGDRPLRLLPTRANTQPAFVVLLGDPGGAVATGPAGVLVLTLARGGVRGITRFLDPRVAALFDVPSGYGSRESSGPTTS